MTRTGAFCLFLVFSCVSKADQVDKIIQVLPSKAQWIAKIGSDILPASQRQGINDYLTVIGMDAARGANSSIVNFNHNIMQTSPCLADLASEFYFSIIKEDLEREAKTAKNHSSIDVPMSLAAQVKDYNKNAGWLWEKAMHYSKGDKLLAFHLIGICGHDDKGQLRNSPIFGIPITKEKAAELKKMILNEGALAKTFSKIEDGVDCPDPSSAFYAPETLGKDYAIPEQLRTRIASIQAPTKGPKFLPGKNYHITGSAYASCFLLRRGVPTMGARKIVMGALNAYRSSRTCEFFETEFQVPPGASASGLAAQFRELQKKNGTEVCRTETAPLACAMMDNFELSDLKDADMTPEIVEKKLKRYLARIDSARMFRSSSFFKKTNGCDGPQLGQGIREFLKANYAEKNISGQTACPADLSKERCLAARKLLETYLVDFEWSEAQHTAGFEFAKKNCPDYDPANPPEKIACNIQGRRYISKDAVKDRQQNK